MKGILGKKLGMTRVYDEDGRSIPVTVVEAGPCTILDIQTQERNGYSALKLGFGKKQAKNVSKAVLGSLKDSGADKEPPALIREIRLENDSDLEKGATIGADIFEENDYADVTGIVKGRGFQGVVKRHNFGGGRASHGGDWTRKPGSIGMCEFPGKVYKGRKMPGHMGNVQRTIQNLQVVSVRGEENLLLIKGSIPGANGKHVIIKQSIKRGASK